MKRNPSLQPVIGVGVILLAVVVTYNASNEPEMPAKRQMSSVIKISYIDIGMTDQLAECSFQVARNNSGD